MTTLLLFFALAVSFALAYFMWERYRVDLLARERLDAVLDDEVVDAMGPVRARRFVRRWRAAPWLFALAVSMVLYFVLAWSLPFVLSVGLILALLGAQLESYFAQRTTAKIELQLADAIDLMIGALSAGAGVMIALDHVVRETSNPLRPQLAEMAGRLRLGDDPAEVFHSLYRRVPLESFQLFSAALAVHWETGGSLAPTLTTVGRTIRDRVEVARRIRSNVVQSQVSTIAVLGITYFLAAIVWRSNPAQMELFVSAAIGQWMIAGSMLLQAFGIVWMAAISKLRPASVTSF